MPSKIRLPDTYFDLVRKFPLTSIRDEKHLDAAIAVLHDLTARKLDAGGTAYLMALTDLVEVYEDIHYPFPSATADELLRLCLEGNGYTPARLAAELGIPRPNLSAALAGKQKLTADQAERLRKRFCLVEDALTPLIKSPSPPPAN